MDFTYLRRTDDDAVAVALFPTSGLQALDAAQYRFGAVSEPLAAGPPEPRGQRLGRVDRGRDGRLRHVHAELARAVDAAAAVASTSVPFVRQRRLVKLLVAGTAALVRRRRLHHGRVDDVVHPGPPPGLSLEHPVLAQGAFPLGVRVVDLRAKKQLCDYVNLFNSTISYAISAIAGKRNAE